MMRNSRECEVELFSRFERAAFRPFGVITLFFDFDRELKAKVRTS